MNRQGNEYICDKCGTDFAFPSFLASHVCGDLAIDAEGNITTELKPAHDESPMPTLMGRVPEHAKGDPIQCSCSHPMLRSITLGPGQECYRCSTYNRETYDDDAFAATPTSELFGYILGQLPMGGSALEWVTPAGRDARWAEIDRRMPARPVLVAAPSVAVEDVDDFSGYASSSALCVGCSEMITTYRHKGKPMCAGCVNARVG